MPFNNNGKCPGTEPTQKPKCVCSGKPEETVVKPTKPGAGNKPGQP